MEAPNEFQTSTALNFQSQNFRRQLDLLQQKYELSEKENQNKIRTLSQQVEILTSNEIKFRNQLANKDKAVYELNNIIKQYQSEVITLKRNLSLKEEKFSSLSSEFSSAKNNCNKISEELSQRQEQHDQLQKNFQQTLEQKNNNDKKIKELVEVMKQYSNELNNFTQKCTSLERENFDLKNINIKLNNDMKDIQFENSSLHLNIEHLETEIMSLKNINMDLNEQNQKALYDNNMYNTEVENMNEKIKDHESSIENYKSLLNECREERNKLDDNLAAYTQMNQKNLEKIAELEMKINTLINDSNDNIKLILDWMDEYMSNYYQPNVRVPDIVLRNANEISKKIYFDSLKNKLENLRVKINEDFFNSEQIKEKINENMFDANEHIKDVSSKIKEIYAGIKYDIQRNKYFEIDFSKMTEGTPDEKMLELLINQLLQFLYSNKHIREEHEEYINKIENENYCFKQLNNQMSSQIEALQKDKKEYEVYYNNKQNQDAQNYEMEIDKIKQSYILLEKKNKSLVTEIELKQLQIHSLEEIINRRNSNSVQGINTSRSAILK